MLGLRGWLLTGGGNGPGPTAEKEGELNTGAIKTQLTKSATDWRLLPYCGNLVLKICFLLETLH